MEPPSYSEMVCESQADFRVRTRIYTNSQVFDDEMHRIFEKTWVYVGHESEVQQGGDYLTRAIGRQPIIVTRGDDGALHVLINSCRHRGNAVCREERGQAHFFRCPYHGWVYANNGALVRVTEQGGYDEGKPKDIDGLIHVPRVATCRGLIFASLSQEGESFDQYFASVKPYVDLWADRSPVGRLRLLRPHRFVYPGNWKFQMENGADGYHPSFTHESAFATLAKFGLRSSSGRIPDDLGSCMGLDHGHSWLSGGFRQSMPEKLLMEYVDGLQAEFGSERADEIAKNRHVLLFPNVYLMDCNIRVIQPVSVDRTVVYSYYTLLEGVSEETNRARLHDLQRRLGTTGFVASDDIEIFSSNQTGVQASSQQSLVLSRGMHREKVYPGGQREGMYSDEAPQRALYREWARLMTMT